MVTDQTALDEFATVLGFAVPPLLAELFAGAGPELHRNYSPRFEVMIVRYLPLAGGPDSALELHRTHAKRAGLRRELFPIAVDEGGRGVFVDCAKPELPVWLYDAEAEGGPPLEDLRVGLRAFMASFDDRIEPDAR